MIYGIFQNSGWPVNIIFHVQILFHWFGYEAFDFLIMLSEIFEYLLNQSRTFFAFRFPQLFVLSLQIKIILVFLGLFYTRPNITFVTLRLLFEHGFCFSKLSPPHPLDIQAHNSMARIYVFLKGPSERKEKDSPSSAKRASSSRNTPISSSTSSLSRWSLQWMPSNDRDAWKQSLKPIQIDDVEFQACF